MKTKTTRFPAFDRMRQAENRKKQREAALEFQMAARKRTQTRRDNAKRSIVNRTGPNGEQFVSTGRRKSKTTGLWYTTTPRKKAF